MRLTGNTQLKIPQYYSDPFSGASSTNLFKHLPPSLTRRRKKFPSSQFDFMHFYKGDKKKNKVKRSWLDMINIFECETDYDEDDYSSDYSGSSEFIRRKSKHKNNKLKKKKKKILIKFVIGFLIFIALKILLKILYDKFIYFFPGVFPTTGRLELEPNEVDHLYEQGRKSNDENLAQHRTFFIPGYDETHIGFMMPIK